MFNDNLEVTLKHHERLLLVRCEVFLIHSTYVLITFFLFVDQFLIYLLIDVAKILPKTIYFETFSCSTRN